MIWVTAFGERNHVIEIRREVFQRRKCDILDVKMFRDMLINFTIEIAQDKLDDLISEIKKSEWKTNLKIDDAELRKDHALIGDWGKGRLYTCGSRLTT